MTYIVEIFLNILDTNFQTFFYEVSSNYNST